ncbi:hypothetical protein QBC43DRAFT_40565 [Cladorrhinum sp. PSN259]|nr:hypothetical protein QBC43DRAFT_40565 [Cladorrhinum sp. PSN259]
MAPSRKPGRSSKMASDNGQQQTHGLRETIGELNNLGLSNPIDFPQIVLIGSNYEGYRLVLEAISRLPFPTKDAFPSRFPTELLLRPAEQTSLHVTANNQPVDGFSKTGFSMDGLPDIIDEVKGRMHAGVADNATDEVLHVEISGPGLPDFTVIDFPSSLLFRQGPKEASGDKLVQPLHEKYLSQEGNIILAIVSAEDESEGAEKFLNKAREFDPNGTRTMGIMTKLEKTDGSTPGSWALRTAQNLNPPYTFGLGWHVFPTHADTESTTSNTETKSGADSDSSGKWRWSRIEPASRGRENLRVKLNTLLLEHIRKKLSGPITEIKQLIAQHESRLTELGDNRKYLIKNVSCYHKLAHDALQGNYTDPFFGKLYSDLPDSSYENRRVRKFRALVKDLNRAFNRVMSAHGHRRLIVWESEDYGSEDSDEEEAGEQPDYLAPLVDLYDVPRPKSVLLQDLERELEAVAPENEGTGFTSSIHGILALHLFRDQIQPWEAIAKRHIELMAHFAHRFAEKVVFHAAGCDTEIGDTLVKAYVDPYFEQKSIQLKAKLDELLYHYRHGYDLQPLHGNHSQLQVSRSRRYDGHAGDTSASKILGISAHSDIYDDTEGLGLSKIVDTMEEYYENALGIFIDNVVVLAVENCLIRDIPSIISFDTVSEIPDKEMQKLVAESKDGLKNKLNRLEKALAACQALQPQEQTGIARGLVLLRPPVTTSRIKALRSARGSPSPGPSATNPGPPTPAPSVPKPNSTDSTAHNPTSNTTQPASTKDAAPNTVNDPPPATSAPKTTGAFGGGPTASNPSTSKPTGGLFGTPTAATSKPTGGLFGASTASTAGPPPSTGGLFAITRSANTTSTDTATSGGLFGGLNASTTTKTGGGLFGGTSTSGTTLPPSGLFSGTGATANAAPSTGGLFGAAFKTAADVPYSGPPKSGLFTTNLNATSTSTAPSNSTKSIFADSAASSTSTAPSNSTKSIFGAKRFPADNGASTATSTGGVFGSRPVSTGASGAPATITATSTSTLAAAPPNSGSPSQFVTKPASSSLFSDKASSKSS